ncbi:MAG: hypothetical protein RSA50_08910, partial [Mucinivorans sp.]
MLYKTNKFAGNTGMYNMQDLQADKTSITEQKIKDTTKNILNVIPDIDKKEYDNKFEVVNGELVYIGNVVDEIEWSNEIGITTR